jgi:enamine deaminase RidA (YjgF/YER057c/UK114 family)
MVDSGSADDDVHVTGASPRIELIDPPDLQPARGFSHVAVGSGSRLVFIAGQTPVDRAFTVVGPGDLGEQTRAAMRNLHLALRAVGATWADVVRRTVFTTRPTEFLEISRAIAAVTGPVRQPPQSIVGVSGLVNPQFLVEIEATALLP